MADESNYFGALHDLYYQAVTSSETPELLGDYGGVIALAGRDAERVRVHQGGILGFIGWMRNASEKHQAARGAWSEHLKAMRQIVASEHVSETAAASRYLSSLVGTTGMPAQAELEALARLSTGFSGTKPSWLYDIQAAREVFMERSVIMADTIPAIATGISAFLNRKAGRDGVIAEDWDEGFEAGKFVKPLSDMLAAHMSARGARYVADPPPRNAPTLVQRGTGDRASGPPARSAQSQAPMNDRGTGFTAAGGKRPRFSSVSSRWASPPRTAPAWPRTLASVPPEIHTAVEQSFTEWTDWQPGNVVIKAPTRPGFVVPFASQANVLGKVLGRKMTRMPAPPTVATRTPPAAPSPAESLRDRIGQKWADATSRQSPSADFAARQAFAKLKQVNPQNPNEWMRQNLFAPWRRRALTAMYNDEALRTTLRRDASIVLEKRKGNVTITISGITPSGRASLPVDFDHADVGHAAAVQEALRTNSYRPLLTTISRDNIQLLTGRENRNQIEPLRANDRGLGIEMPRRE